MEIIKGETIVATKMRYESLGDAIRWINNHPDKLKDSKVVAEAINALTSEKVVLGGQLNEMYKGLLNIMSSNYLPLHGDWVAIRHRNNAKQRDPGITITAVEPKSLYMLELDPVRKSDFTMQELEHTLPAITSAVTLEMYEADKLQLTNQIIVEAGFTLDSEGQPDTSIKASRHSCLRWVQRRLGIINKQKAEEYLKLNYSTVHDEVLRGHSKSKLVWTDEEGIEYYMDTNNIAYIVGNNTIVTLYEEDFGFTKDINKMIVTQQLKVIKKAWKSLEKSQDTYSDYVEDIDRQVSDIDAQIESLKAKIEELKATKTVLAANRDLAYKTRNAEREQFNMEFSKLFKRYKNS